METQYQDRADVEAQIRAAFAGVKLGKGVSLRQAQVIDRYGEGMTDREFEAVPGGEITDSWSDVPFSELERDCIAHLDDDGLRYYLPALMLSLLSNYDPTSMRVIGTIGALYPKIAGFRSFAYLTDDQHRAVACFLNALPHLVMLDTEDSKCVARALRNYWGQFAAPLPRSGL
jgi:hypothetical protein